MYGSVRIFKVDPGQVETAEAATWSACINALKAQPGFRDMYSIRSGPDEFITIGIYDDEASASASMEQVNPIFLSAVSELVRGQPLRYQGLLTHLISEG